MTGSLNTIPFAFERLNKHGSGSEKPTEMSDRRLLTFVGTRWNRLKLNVLPQSMAAVHNLSIKHTLLTMWNRGPIQNMTKHTYKSIEGEPSAKQNDKWGRHEEDMKQHKTIQRPCNKNRSDTWYSTALNDNTTYPKLKSKTTREDHAVRQPTPHLMFNTHSLHPRGHAHRTLYIVWGCMRMLSCMCVRSQWPHGSIPLHQKNHRKT